MCRTDAITVSDGRQALHVSAEQARKHLGLGLTHLGELSRHVGDRAVVLAHLGASRGGADRGREALLGEGAGQHIGAIVGRSLLEQWANTIFQIGHAVLREVCDGLISTGLTQVAQGPRGQIVVGLAELVAAGVGECEDLGRSATTTLSEDALIARLDSSFDGQLVEVPAYSSGSEVQLLSQICGGRWAVRKDGPGHACARGSVGGITYWRRLLFKPHVFHNTSVPLIVQTIQVRWALPTFQECAGPTSAAGRTAASAARVPAFHPRASNVRRRGPVVTWGKSRSNSPWTASA